MLKRVFSLLLCLVLCLSAFPAGAFATEAAAPAETVEELLPEESPEEIIPIEEPITEEPPAEESPAEPVEVTFECAETEDLSALTVYDAEGAVVPPVTDADTGEALYGRYALLPGEYSYSFYAEGFEPLENVPFTVTDADLTVTVILTALSEEEQPEAFMMLTALSGGEPEEVHAITYSELQELLGEDAGVSLSALLSALSLSVEMAEVTAVETSDESVFIVVKDTEGVDWTVSVLKAPAPQASISVTVGTLEYNIVVTNDVDEAKTETVTYIDANGNPQSQTCYILESKTDYTLEAGKWYAVKGDITISNRIENNAAVGTPAHLILVDGARLNLPGGIHNPEGKELIIYGQQGCSGELSVTGTAEAGEAGIGGNYGENGGTLTINGGKVVVRVPVNQASRTGIGGGSYSHGGIITINGGEVYANASFGCAAIGGGARGASGVITINGGTVYADGGGYGPGIGRSYGNLIDSYPGPTEIYINGGFVSASGGEAAAGIGGGMLTDGCDVVITGGSITATGGPDDPQHHGVGMGIGSGGSSGTKKWLGKFEVDEKCLIYAGNSAADATLVEWTSSARAKFVRIDTTTTPYEVNHRVQTVDGSAYELRETETLYGIAELFTAAKARKYDGFTCTGIVQQYIEYDGSTVINIDYSRNEYAITFNANGHGTAPEKITARFGATVTVDPGAMEEAGYVFNGWFEDEACTKPFTVPQTVAMPLNGFTLYAKWTVKTDTPYTVKHYQQKADGTGYELKETTPMTGTSGQPTAAEAKTYSGFTAAAFAQKPISGDGSTVIEIKYNRNSYTLTFNANGHGTAPAAITALYGAPITKPADPEATGYSFGGWFEDESCTKAFIFSEMPLGGKTLFAKWTAKVYDVTFDGNYTGSSYNKVVKQTYGETYVFPEDEPERSGYNFTGWYTKAMKGEEIEEGDKFPYSDEFDTLTVFAHWRVATHIYGPASYKWEGDSCTASRICTKCPEPHTQTETVTGFYVEDTPATCLTASKGHYRAVFTNTAFVEQNTAANSVTGGGPLGHSYGDAAYTWDENKCTATRKCIRCDLSESETATGSYVKDTDAACLAAETGHYKATFTNPAFAEQSTARGSVTRGEPLGHSYGDAFYAWNEDKCTATRICTRCDVSESETATGSYVKDTDATCATAETGHYKATFTNAAFAGQSTAKDSVTKGEPLGHSYGAASYTWNNDECTAEHKCTRCDVTESETVKGTYAKDTDATCTEAEKGHYTATFTNTAFEPQSTPVTVGEPLGHIFPDTWQQFGAQQHMHQCTREGCRIYDFEDHTFSGDICTKCGYVKKTLQISVSGRPYCDGASSAVDLTFTLNGETCAVTYPEGLNWREFDPTVDYLTTFGEPGAATKLKVGKTYVTQFIVQVPFKSLPLGSTAVPEIASDFFTVGCTEPIPVAEASCYEMRLTLVFTLTHASLQEAHGQAATCTQDGWKDCWHCTACNKYYEDAACQTLINDYETWKTGAGIIPAGHSYGDVAYAWDEDRCTATHECTRCAESTPGHTESETVTGSYVEDTPATCLTASKGHYRAIFANAAFAEQNTAKDSVTSGEPLGHSYGTASYSWNEDKCTATHTCTRCAEGTEGHTETETVTGSYVKDTDATCNAAETGHYKAAFTNTAFAGQSTARGSVMKGDPLGHSYGDPFYAWNEDQCTATRTCTRCAEGTEGHTQAETATGVYTKEADATCTEAEKGHYTATFINTAFEPQRTPVTVGEPLGHAFPDTWQPYSAQQHMRQCTREGCQAYDYEDHSFHGNTCTTCGYVKSSEYLIILGANGTWTQRSGNALPFTSNAPFDRFVSVKVDGDDIPESCYTAEEGSTKVNLLPAYLETLSLGQHSLDIVSSDGEASTAFTVKAVPIFYTVSFNMRGHGVQVADQRVERGGVAAKPADPSASGYIFYGWYADAAYRTKYNFSTPVNGDTVLYARWVSSTDPGSPKTGDDSRLALWAVMFSVSGIALAGGATLRKKKTKT